MLPVAVLTRAAWPKTPAALAHVAVSGLLMHGVYLGGVFTAIGLGLPSGITALLAWALFDETLSPLALTGMTIAAGGVWLARR